MWVVVSLLLLPLVVWLGGEGVGRPKAVLIVARWGESGGAKTGAAVVGACGGLSSLLI